MKTCPKCSAENYESAKFCNDCGADLSAAPEASEGGGKVRKSSRLSMAELKASLTSGGEKFRSSRQADVLFVLDVTGSMGGEIDAIKSAIVSFADSIEQDGVDVRVGMLAFRDRTYGEEPELLTFGGEVFTKDASSFSKAVGKLRATGGGDIPESSLDAILLALRQPFGEGRQKVLVLITDAPPQVPDVEARSVEQVVEAISEVGVDQIYLVIRTMSAESQVYLKLLHVSRGLAFELGKGEDFRERSEHFKTILKNLGKTISSATR